MPPMKKRTGKKTVNTTLEKKTAQSRSGRPLSIYLSPEVFVAMERHLETLPYHVSYKSFIQRAVIEHLQRLGGLPSGDEE